MSITLDDVASLLRRTSLSADEYFELLDADTQDKATKVVQRLSTAHQISESDRDYLIFAAGRQDAGERTKWNAAEREKLRRELREAERYATGRVSTPFAQGGYPSLGKRRP
jgi:hypothetical protein